MERESAAGKRLFLRGRELAEAHDVYDENGVADVVGLAQSCGLEIKPIYPLDMLLRIDATDPQGRGTIYISRAIMPLERERLSIATAIGHRELHFDPITSMSHTEDLKKVSPSARQELVFVDNQRGIPNQEALFFAAGILLGRMEPGMDPGAIRSRYKVPKVWSQNYLAAVGDVALAQPAV